MIRLLLAPLAHAWSFFPLAGLGVGLVVFGLLLRWRVWIVVAIAVAAGAWISAGVVGRVAQADLLTQLEQARQQERDRAAAVNAEAQRWQKQYVAWMEARTAALEAKVRENDEAALRDPDAHRLGIGRGSVRRLNQIRP